ncbi:MAG: hypothetical protein WEB58_09045 [Planctomycetaceae bacterium]
MQRNAHLRAIYARHNPFSLREKVAEGRMRVPSGRKNGRKSDKKPPKPTKIDALRAFQRKKARQNRRRVRNRTHDAVSLYDPLADDAKSALRTHVIACM